MSEFDPDRILGALHDAGVDFVLIGGLAAVVHGSTLTTADVDVTPERSAENLERLAAALRSLGARLRTESEPDGVPFPIDAGFLAAQPALLNLVTEAGDVDLAFAPAGHPGGYVDLRSDAIVVSLVEGAHTAVASLDDVIASKRAADRPKDRAALPYLEELRRQLERDGLDR